MDRLSDSPVIRRLLARGLKVSVHAYFDRRAARLLATVTDPMSGRAVSERSRADDVSGLLARLEAASVKADSGGARELETPGPAIPPPNPLAVVSGIDSTCKGMGP